MRNHFFKLALESLLKVNFVVLRCVEYILIKSHEKARVHNSNEVLKICEVQYLLEVGHDTASSERAMYSRHFAFRRMEINIGLKSWVYSEICVTLILFCGTGREAFRVPILYPAESACGWLPCLLAYASCPMGL